MEISLQELQISVNEDRVDATLLAPASAWPGILFVHGWGGSQSQDLARAREASGLGCVCLTFDLRGHDLDGALSRTVTRAQNLQDLIAAYDWLAAQPTVERNSIAVVGISYGGYLASILTSLRPVRWLALRAPAIYRDEGWELPKRALNANPELAKYRLEKIAAADNLALKACAAFRGDALIVESQNDNIVPHAVIENYVAALSNARSLTSRIIEGVDHALTEESAQKAYNSIVINWLTEMLTGARASSATSQIERHQK